MATQVDLGKIRPVWKGAWAATTAYERNDMVREGVNSYICVTAHTSGATFSDANWHVLAYGSDIPDQTGNSGKVLLTDGTNMSWGDSNNASALTTGTLSTDRLPAGTIVQAVPVRWSSRFTGSGKYTDSGLDLVITPKYANSIIMLNLNMQLGTNGTTVGYNVYRNNARVNGVLSASGSNSGDILSSSGGPSSSSWNVSVGFVGYDQPNTTSAVTYSIYVGSHDGRTWYVNTSGSSTQHDGAGRISGGVAYEIAQ